VGERPCISPPVGRARGPRLTRLLLDTTFLVDADRSGGALDALIDDEDEAAVAAVTVAELRVGVLLSTARYRDGRQAFLDDVLASLPVIDYDSAVATAHADLLAYVRRQGSPRGAHDLMIAATAVAHGRTVVTADSDAFGDLPGVPVRAHR